MVFPSRVTVKLLSVRGHRTVSDVIVDFTVAVNQKQRSGRTEEPPFMGWMWVPAVLTPLKREWWKRNRLDKQTQVRMMLAGGLDGSWLLTSSVYSHLPSSPRHSSLLSVALAMTSTRSPAFTASSLLAHFLLVSVGTTVAWYSTRISPSYWHRLRKRARSEQTIVLFLSETITQNASACSRRDVMDRIVIEDKEGDKL